MYTFLSKPPILYLFLSNPAAIVKEYFRIATFIDKTAFMARVLVSKVGRGVLHASFGAFL